MAYNQTIQHKRSTVATNVPGAAAIAIGEIAINFADKSIYTKDAGGNVIELERDIARAATAPAAPFVGEVWYNTTTNMIQVWDGARWQPLEATGKQFVPGNFTYTSGFAGGAGTAGSPYAITNLIVESSKNVMSEVFTLTGLQPNQPVLITDVNGSSRFTVSNKVADAAGDLAFTVTFLDFPASAAGTQYTANLVLNAGGVLGYVDVIVDIIAANVPMQVINWPTTLQPVTTAWTDANDTLTSTSCALISTDNVTYNQGPLNINTGDTLYVKWDGAPGGGTCADSADGTVINGTIVNSNGDVSSGTFTVDKNFSFTWVDTIDHALSEVTQSNTINVSGINSWAYIYSTSGTTGLEYSRNGGAWTAVPSAANAVDWAVDGDTVQVRHTNSATNSTQTSSDVFIGVQSDSYDTTTVGLAPAIGTPSITAPADNATGVATAVTINSSAYNPINNPGPHTQSDWEIYSDAGGTTLVTSSMGSTTNLTSWSPAGLAGGTDYWVRVKHRDDGSTGATIESQWSALSKFSTAASAPTAVADLSTMTTSNFNTYSSSCTTSGQYGYYWNDDGSITRTKIALNQCSSNGTVASGGPWIVSGVATDFEYRIVSSWAAGSPAANMSVTVSPAVGDSGWLAVGAGVGFSIYMSGNLTSGSGATSTLNADIQIRDVATQTVTGTKSITIPLSIL